MVKAGTYKQLRKDTILITLFLTVSSREGPKIMSQSSGE